MANPSKDAGTRQETKIVRTLNEYAGEKVAERVALHGRLDHGDIRIVVDGMVLCGESKHSKYYPTVGMMAEHRRQTVEEMHNSCSDGCVLFVNLPNKGMERMECHMPRATYERLHGTDLLVRRLLGREGLTEEARTDAKRLEEELLRGDAETDWLCVPLSTFMSLAWGSREGR